MVIRVMIPLLLAVCSCYGQAVASDLPDSCCTYSKVSDSLFAIANSPSPMRHFALLYYRSTLRIEQHSSTLKPVDQQLLEREVYAFYVAVRKANEAYLRHYVAPPGSWQFYLSDTGRSTLFYNLAGLNAHINGDSHNTLKTTYTSEELKAFKPVYKSLDQVLVKMADSLYPHFRTVKAFDRAHRISLGGSKLYMRHLLYSWRRQQFRIAQCWYTKPKKYQRLAAKSVRRKAKWDAFAAKYF